MRRRALKDGFKKGGLYPAFFLLLTIFVLSIFQIKSYDLWWHLKAGESIVGTGLKPVPTNIFSWTEPDHPWINFSWLFDVVVYLIHKTAGFNGLIVFQAILVTAVFFFVYKTVLTPPPPLFNKEGAGGRYGIFALLLIAYFAVRFRFSLRPHLFALLIFAIDIYLLNKLSAFGSQRTVNPLSLWERVPLIAIPLLQILWANIHGSAIVGVLLPGIYIIGAIINPPQSTHPGINPFTKGGRKGDFPLILILTAIASLLNPYGYHILTDSLAPFFGQGADLFNTLAIDEWQVPGKDMFFGWYGLLLAIGITSFLLPFLSFRERKDTSSLSLRERVRVRVRVRVGYTDLLLFSTFALLSIKAVRFIDLFVVAAVPVIYKNVISGQWSVVSEGREKLNSHPSSLILHPFLVLSLFWFFGIKDTAFTFGLGVDKEVIPQKTVEFMEMNGIRGKIFNSYNFGGYLIYKGYPVFIDGRLCYSPELVKNFADANLTDSGWKRVDERYKPDMILVEYDKPAIPEALVSDKKNWALVYWDDLDMLFLKRNDKFSAIIDKNEYMAVNPMDMYGRGGFPSPGGRGLRGGGAMNIHSHPDPLPSRERGDILFWEKAIFAEAQRKIKDGPESMRAHLLMGNLYMNRGEADRGIVEYETVIKSSLSFGKAEAHNNLGTVYEKVGDVYGAEEAYKTAIRLDRVYPLPQRNLGYLKLGQSDYIEALWHLERFLQLDGSDRNTWAVVSELKKYRDNLILRVFIGGMVIIGIMWITARQFNRRETVPLPL